VWASNGFGLILALYYCWEFMKFAPQKGASPTLPGTVAQHVQFNFFILLTTLALVFFYPKIMAAKYVGSLGVVLCVAMFASPLAALKSVMETKSAKAIPLPFTLAAVANCFLWSVFGWFDMKDANIYAPNLLGLSFGLAQVGLKLKYGSGEGTKETSSIDLPL
jgi:solute carrier family 50 protein (sugar transporter)